MLPAVNDGQGFSRKGVAEDGGVLEERALLGGQCVEPGGDEGLQGLGDLEGAELARDVVEALTLDKHPTVDEHPDGLDRIERDPLRPFEDARGDGLGQALDEPVEQVAHCLGRERLEVERGEIALAGSPGGPTVDQLRAGEGDHHYRVVP